MAATDHTPVDEWVKLGCEAHAANKLVDAGRHYHNALRLQPNHVTATHNLAVLLAQTGQLNEGLLAMERATLFDPHLALAWANLTLMCLEADRIDQGLEAAGRGLALTTTPPVMSDPLAVAVYLNVRLAACMVSAAAGYPDRALPLYREMLAVDPKHPAASPNACFVQTLTAVGPAELLAQRAAWHAAHGYTGDVWPHGNTKDPDRKLRIGYVSGDFKSHSAAMMFSNVVLNHDREKFDVYLYSCLPTNPEADDLTRTFKASAAEWREIYVFSDEDADNQIRNDKIDVLVDLAGHTNGGRLGLFSRKPAPVQVTAWGFAHGTGVPAIDYFFADPVAVPPEERGHFAEKVWDLPSIVTYRPPVEYGLRAANPLPYHANEYVTFGTFSRYEKLSNDCLETFAEILRRVPESRLFLKDHSFRRPYAIRRVRAALADIDPARLLFGISTSHPEHMQAYQSCDLYLDTWPHGAGVVTLEALYMGIPIITRYGTQPSGRTASSVLTALGRTDWVTRTREEFVEKAVEWANRPQDLGRARKTLRQELVDSPVVTDYVRRVEDAYREFWREWCAKGDR